MVEQLTVNQLVVGSNPPLGAMSDSVWRPRHCQSLEHQEIGEMVIDMKYFAYLLNIGWLVVFAFFSFDRGLPSGDEAFFVLAAIVTSVVSIITLLRSSETKEGWLGLLLQRKALEEKQKIVSIQSDLKR